MKKTVMVLIASVIMSGNIMADEYKVMSSGIFLGVNMLDTGGEEDKKSYEFGRYIMLGDQFRYGGEANLAIVNGFSEMICDFGARVGYALLPNLDVFTTLGYGLQTLGIVSSDGLVYGLGLHYGVNNSVGLLVDYKKYDLEYEYYGVKNDLSSIGLKINFAF